MSHNPEARMHGIQAQLPLLDAEPEATDPTRQAPLEEDRCWHLDPHTREVGRRGIAAARAHLRGATGRAA